MSKLAPFLLLISTIALFPGALGAVSLDLPGASSLKLPNTTFTLQGISYSFQAIRSLEENGELAGLVRGVSEIVEVQLLPLRLSQSKLLTSAPLKHRIFMPDRDGNISFRLGKVPCGAYILLAKNRKESTPLAVAPLLVQKRLLIDAPDRLNREAALPVKLQAAEATNHSMGAILLPAQDYYRSNITLADNLIIQRGDLVASLNDLTQDSMLSLLAILPRDCTQAFEPDAGRQCTLNLFTDREWHPGQYILIGIAYNQQETSLAQKFVELI